jgi:peptidoglycan/LPS O-acetylase OafA/YrhL
VVKTTAILAEEAVPDTTVQALVSTPSLSRSHLDFLDGLRALAALFVVFNHLWLTVWNSHTVFQPDRTLPLMTGWLQYGHFAVGVFIVLSGFCLMLPVVRGDGTLPGGAKHFFKKRARRILPPYYGALGLSLALIAWGEGTKTNTVWDVSLPVTLRGVVTHVLLVHDVFKSDMFQISYPLWSIAVEWQIYFLFPALIAVWARIGGLAATGGALLAGGLGIIAVRHMPWCGIPFSYFGLFGLGMLAAAISFANAAHWQMYRERVPWRAVTLAPLLLLILLCRGHGVQVFDHAGSADGLVGLSAMGLLIMASRPCANRLRRVLSWRPLVFVGAFSYSLYLIHAPLIQVLWRCVLHPCHFTEDTTFALLVICGVPLLVGAAYLFFLLFERPFINPLSMNINNINKRTWS